MISIEVLENPRKPSFIRKQFCESHGSFLVDVASDPGPQITGCTTKIRDKVLKFNLNCNGCCYYNNERGDDVL